MDQYFQVEVQFLPGHQGLELQNTVRKLADEYASAGIFEYERSEDFSDQLFGGEIFATHLSLQQLELVEQGNQNEKLEWKVYFDQGALATSFCQKLEALNQENKGLMVKDLGAVEDENWKHNWKDFHRPKEIGSDFKIVPYLLGEKLKDGNHEFDLSRDILIVPGMGFGTGEHETTWMCLEEIAHLARTGLTFSKCLDFGCGSGVLGLAAIKHLKIDVQADFFDIDSDALENCHCNCEINLTNEYISSSSSSSSFLSYPSQRAYSLFENSVITSHKSSLTSTYDLIFANILQDVLLQEVDFFKERIRPQGMMLLSGILTEQVPQVLKTFESRGFFLSKRRERQGWEMLSLQFCPTST